MKKVVAVIFLQLYLVSVFGVTLHQQFCCDTHIVDECHLLEQGVHNDHTHTETGAEDHCPFCSLTTDIPQQGHLDQADDSCCMDCQSLVITAHESKNQQIELTNLLAASSFKFQPTVLVMNWIPDLMKMPDLRTPYSTYNPLTTAIPDQVPIFIRNCTYRL